MVTWPRRGRIMPVRVSHTVCAEASILCGLEQAVAFTRVTAAAPPVSRRSRATQTDMSILTLHPPGTYLPYVAPGQTTHVAGWRGPESAVFSGGSARGRRAAAPTPTRRVVRSAAFPTDADHRTAMSRATHTGRRGYLADRVPHRHGCDRDRCGIRQENGADTSSGDRRVQAEATRI